MKTTTFTQKTHLKIMKSLEHSRQVNTILKGNLRIYLTPNESEVRGTFDHELTFSNKNEVDFQVARKNNVGSWLNGENAVKEIIGDLFEDGFTGTGQDLVKEINDAFLVRKETLFIQERQKADEKITTTFNILNGLMQRLCKSTAENLKVSFVSRNKSGDLDKLYRNDLKYLTEEVSNLLSDSEQVSLKTISTFFNALDDCNDPSSFAQLQTFCKN